MELEEAFIETVALGNGLKIKAGRFFSAIGYLNQQHGHAWDFVDAPLIYRGLFGDQLIDDGVQVSWVAPTDIYLQLGGELLRGERFPAGGASNDGKGAGTLFAKIGGDIGESHAWQLGLSHWRAEVEERTSGGHHHEGEAEEVPTYSGDSKVTGIDFVWKWAPLGNASERNFKLQGEYFMRDERVMSSWTTDRNHRNRPPTMGNRKGGIYRDLSVHAPLARRLALRPARFGQQGV